MAATVFAVRESRDETVDRHVDYPGVVALTASLTAIILALIEGKSWGWGSTGIVSLLAGGVIGLAAFVAIELRVTSPMVEFALFRTRQFIGSNLIAFIITFAMMGTFFFMAIYMQDILGFSALEAGVRFLPTTMVIAVVAPISGRLADRLGGRSDVRRAVCSPSPCSCSRHRHGYHLGARLSRSSSWSRHSRDVTDVDCGDERGQRQKPGVASGVLQGSMVGAW